MDRYFKLLTLCVFALAAMASRAGTVGTWDLSGLRPAAVDSINERLASQLKEYVEMHCRELTPGLDEVKVISQTVTHTDYYPLMGNQYYPLDYTDIVLVRTNGIESYQIKAKSEWDYDLPVPMLYAYGLDSENCHYSK